MEIHEIHKIMNHWRGMYKVLEQDWQKVAKEHGLTPAEQHVIWILHFEKEATMTRIADIGLWDVSTVMQMTKRLQEKGLIETKKMDHDRRISYVSLTEEGRNRREKTENYDYQIVDCINQIISEKGYSPEFLHELSEFQKAFNERFHGKDFVNWVERTSNELQSSKL